MVGYAESAKGSVTTKIFEDAYKSPFSIVILVRHQLWIIGCHDSWLPAASNHGLRTAGRNPASSISISLPGLCPGWHRAAGAPPFSCTVLLTPCALLPPFTCIPHPCPLLQDDIERLLEYVAIGPRFSNLVLQASWAAGWELTGIAPHVAFCGLKRVQQYSHTFDCPWAHGLHPLHWAGLW